MPRGDSPIWLAVIGVGLLVLWWDDPTAEGCYLVILLTLWLLNRSPDRTGHAPGVEQLPQ